jgi:1-acyl-sn-glycerol-3-phosphate acyltransferase
MNEFEKFKEAIRFDMKRKPVRQRHYLRPVTWLLSYPTTIKRKLKIYKKNMEGVKPPYLLLCTHHAFNDFKVTTAAIFPHRANYVIAIDGFIGREWLLRQVGGIGKRKFTNDVQLVRQIRHVLTKQGDILALYPEARYSLVGTNAVLPASLGKMAKLLGVPVVMLNMHGNYLNSPCWNLHQRGNRLEADLSLLFTPQELVTSSVSSINDRINKAFEYDEYRWQKENNIIIDYPKRAEGLHKVLYQCAHCKSEYSMSSKDSTLVCNCCHKEWHMSTLGELEAVKKADDETSLHTEFTHIPHWYEYQRAQVKKEIEHGTYHINLTVTVDALPNAKRYIRLGKAQLTHSLSGFTLSGMFDGESFELKKSVESMYSCHIEFDYFGKGDCIDLSTLDDTYYLFPEGNEFSVTKIALATEELFFAAQKK